MFPDSKSQVLEEMRKKNFHQDPRTFCFELTNCFGEAVKMVSLLELWQGDWLTGRMLSRLGLAFVSYDHSPTVLALK